MSLRDRIYCFACLWHARLFGGLLWPDRFQRLLTDKAMVQEMEYAERGKRELNPLIGPGERGKHVAEMVSRYSRPYDCTVACEVVADDGCNCACVNTEVCGNRTVYAPFTGTPYDPDSEQD